MEWIDFHRWADDGGAAVEVLDEPDPSPLIIYRRVPVEPAKYEALNDRLIIELEEQPKKTPGGIILPDKVKREDGGAWARVRSVSPLIPADKLQGLGYGSRVLVPLYTGILFDTGPNTPTLRAVRLEDVVARDPSAAPK